eukprot:s824_g18.t1
MDLSDAPVPSEKEKPGRAAPVMEDAPLASDGTYYQILGVAPDASSEEIKLQCLDWGPWGDTAQAPVPEAGTDLTGMEWMSAIDKNQQDPNATEKFQSLQEAYEVLSDPDRRSAYDQNSDFIMKLGLFSIPIQPCWVPSSRTFWCLLVEACISDDAKSLSQLAQQLEDEAMASPEKDTMKNARRCEHRQGRVVALLPHALLLEATTSERFLAPLRFLTPEVLQAVAAGESPSVSFQVHWQPGAREAEGCLRAFGVTADDPLRHSAAEDLPQGLEGDLEDLDSLSEGLTAAKKDPNLMQEVFARCIAALTAPQNRTSLLDRGAVKRSSDRGAGSGNGDFDREKRRGRSGLRLLRLLRQCLRSLLLSGPRTARHLRPQLLHCRTALAAYHASTSPSKVSSRMMAWAARVGRLVARGLVAARHRRPRVCHRRDVKCNVKGCHSAGHGRVKDLWGVVWVCVGTIGAEV